MTYKLTHESVVRVVKLLDQMKDSKESLVWNVDPSISPDRAAYELRQGMRAAIALGYNQYNDLVDRFVIKSRPGKLIAERRSGGLNDLVFKQSMSRMILADISTMPEIIGAILKHQQEEMYFPAAVLTEEELTNLATWINSSETMKGYYLIKNVEGITVTKNEETRSLAYNNAQ